MPIFAAKTFKGQDNKQAKAMRLAVLLIFTLSSLNKENVSVCLTIGQECRSFEKNTLKFDTLFRS